MALYVVLCKHLDLNVENFLVRTFMLFPKHVTFTPWYVQLVLGNNLTGARFHGGGGGVGGGGTVA